MVTLRYEASIVRSRSRRVKDQKIQNQVTIEPIAKPKARRKPL